MTTGVGVPDLVRTEGVKAFIVLKPDYVGADALARGIQRFVETRMAAHEYLREVAFVEPLPISATGKIMRRMLHSP